MRIITLHCDYIKFKAIKKALKSAAELTEKEKGEKEIKDPLVVLTAVEEGDNDHILKQYIDSIKKTAGEVKAKKIVLYPYAHLSNNLANPETAKEYMIEAEEVLGKEGFEVTRAPFGYYKEFELKCKGHPLSELSKEFRVGTVKEIEREEIAKLAKAKAKGQVAEKEKSPSELLREISRSKLDTSKLKENDHRILGQKLDLFSFNEVAPGMVFWHDKGLIIYNELINYWREVHRNEGYIEIKTPQIMDSKLWKISGHWDLYKENNFKTDYEGRPFLVKPMNCPGGMLVYKTKTRSYKDLPMRVGEVGTVHRTELSGVLAGLFRVIQFTQDDAHIFCTQEQIQSEIVGVINLFRKVLSSFGFKYSFTLSTRSEEKKDKYLGDDKLWSAAEKALAEGLKSQGLKFETVPGEAKFYGPSLDVLIKDSLGREWQCSTLQLDFNLPQRFEIEYIDSDGQKKTPIMLHRVVFGSLERFIGVMLEHTNGALPLWLSPVQVKVINFTDRNTKAAEKVVEKIKKDIPNIRIEADFRNATVNDKVRDSEMMKIPFLITIGDKEEEKGTIAVKKRGQNKPEFGVKLESFIKELKDKIEKRG